RKSTLYLWLIIFIWMAVPSSILPQGNYIDAPFGGGGGYTPGWYIPNLDPINQRVKAFGVPELSTSGFYTSGGAGMIYLGLIPGIRIGGMGFGGSTSESSVVNGFNRKVIYSLGGGGFTVEYTLPFVRDLGISIGAIIGGGSLEVEIYKTKNNYNWGEIWDWENRTVPAGEMEVANAIDHNFWFISPTLNIDIPVYRFVILRLGAGYQIDLGNSWTSNNGAELNNVPSDLDANTFFIQSGIFIGFFSF